MTEHKAIERAITLDKRDGQTRFVVFDPTADDYTPRDHCYFVTDSVGLDTFYLGTPQSDIIFCTAD